MSLLIREQKVREELKSAIDSARSITEAAAKEARPLTPEESKKVQDGIDTVKGLSEEIRKFDSEREMRKSLDDLGTGIDFSPPADDQASPSGAKGAARGSIGQQFVDSDGYKGLLKRGTKGQWSTGAVEINAKTLLSEGAGSGAQLIQPDVQPGLLPLLFRRLTVSDLLPSGVTTSNTVRYLKETTATNAAATVAEGGTKPESTLVFAQVDEAVSKIATIIPVTDEMLEDYGQIATYLDNRLRLFVQLTEEDQLLNGNGTPPNLTGILNRAGIQTQARGTDSRADAIFKAITKIRATGFLEPDGIVIHPTDWQTARLEKDANGQYFSMGPFAVANYATIEGITSDRIWGMNVVVTPAIAQGTALVGAFGASAQVFRRGGLTVEASNSHSTFFAENKTAIRAEERLALAVYRAAGFATVTSL